MYNIHHPMHKYNETTWQLKDREFDAKKFFRILAKIVEQFGPLAGELIYVRGGLIEAVVERFVGDKFTQRPLTRLGVGQNSFDPCRSRIKFFDRGLSVFVKFVVF